MVAISCAVVLAIASVTVNAIPISNRKSASTKSISARSSADSDSSNLFSSMQGPVISSNFPDPAVLYVGDTTYAFATTDKTSDHEARPHVQLATSKDNQTWTVTGTDALPTPGDWQTGDAVWAPSVVQVSSNKFVLYYADSLKSHPTKHCIGAATSTTGPQGPYTPQTTPLICPDPTTQGGAIDAAGFLDPSTGNRYIVYKVDGNSIGNGGVCGNTVAPIVPTPLVLQQVDPRDGITFIGSATQLLNRDASDGPLVEAPSIHRSSNGTYFLFYSSGCYSTAGYDVKYATAPNITGPYTRAGTPLLSSGDRARLGLDGPGGMDVIAGGSMVGFHGILQNDQSSFVRGMYTAKLGFDGTTAYVS